MTGPKGFPIELWVPSFGEGLAGTCSVTPTETAATSMERANDTSLVREDVVVLVEKAERERRAELEARMEAILAA